MGAADVPETGRTDVVDGESPPDLSQPCRDFRCNVVKRLSLISSAKNGKISIRYRGYHYYYRIHRKAARGFVKPTENNIK